MHIAGLVLDIYDQTDSGLLADDKDGLKTAGLLTAKLCSVEDLDRLPDSAFGLVGMTKNGSGVRKFALHDADATRLSAFYFAKNYKKLPPKVAEVVAIRLHDACRRHKVASPLGDVAISAEDLDHALACPTIDLGREDGIWPSKKAQSQSQEKDYVLVEQKPDGLKVGHYYVPDLDSLEEAAAAFEDGGWAELGPGMRVKIASGLRSRLQEAKLAVTEKVAAFSATSISPEIGHWLDSRKRLVPNTSWSALDEMYEKRATFSEHKLGRALEIFDQMHGLDEHWGRGVRDPYLSCYAEPGPQSIKVGELEVTEDQIRALARDTKKLASFFSLSDIAELQKDPIGAFNSLPKPTKELLAEAMVG
jgi:hypothetical protein